MKQVKFGSYYRRKGSSRKKKEKGKGERKREKGEGKRGGERLFGPTIVFVHFLTCVPGGSAGGKREKKSLHREGGKKRRGCRRRAVKQLISIIPDN